MRYHRVKTILEWFSVGKIITIFIAWIFVFGFIYWGASQQPSDVTLTYNGKPASDFADSLYFSVVTATTLGYGDVVATKWLRFVAMIEVLGGLMLGGLAVSTLAATPLRQTRLAIRECVGIWIERVEFKGDKSRIFYSYTHITANDASLEILGENFDFGHENDQTTYSATLIANQFPTLIFTYTSDVTMADYSTGIYKITMRQSASGHFNEYYGECYDAKHGLRDQIRAYKVTKKEYMQKLDDPRTRREEMRKLIKEIFQEEIPT